jgi:hypothetical protein
VGDEELDAGEGASECVNGLERENALPNCMSKTFNVSSAFPTEEEVDDNSGVEGAGEESPKVAGINSGSAPAGVIKYSVGQEYNIGMRLTGISKWPGY